MVSYTNLMRQLLRVSEMAAPRCNLHHGKHGKCYERCFDTKTTTGDKIKRNPKHPHWYWPLRLELWNNCNNCVCGGVITVGRAPRTFSSIMIMSRGKTWVRTTASCLC